MPSAIKPGIYNEQLADENVVVRTEDAYDMARFLARQQGLFVGISAAAAVMAAVEVARELEDGVVVTVLPDNGFKYLSDKFWTQR
jgi:cysteine synthase B